jgi:hypothetical protein
MTRGVSGAIQNRQYKAQEYWIAVGAGFTTGPLKEKSASALVLCGLLPDFDEFLRLQLRKVSLTKHP